MEAPTARWRGGRQADRPAGGRQAPPNIKAEVPRTPAFAANNIHKEKKERCGVREGVATAIVKFSEYPTKILVIMTNF